MSSNALVEQFLDAVTELFPEYQKIPEDGQMSKGHGAVCVIDADGMVYGKIFGTDPRHMRGVFDIAHKKVTQVWLTGWATYDFEKKIFAGELKEDDFPIIPPDYIGWEGGLPLVIGGRKISAAFSGFRGFNDQDILRKAAERVNGKK